VAIIDRYVIPDDQYKLYEAGRFNDTPILVGYNSDEGASFSPPKTPSDYISSVRHTVMVSSPTTFSKPIQ